MMSLREGLELSTGGVVCFVGAGGKTSLMYRLARELTTAGESVLTTTTTKMRMPDRLQAETVMISPFKDAIISRVERFRVRNFHFTAAAERLDFQNKLKGYPSEFIDDVWRLGLFRWILVEADGAAGRSLKAPADHEPVIPSCTGWVIGIVGLDAVGKTLDERWVFRADLFAKRTGLALGQKISAEAIASSLTHPQGIFKGRSGRADPFVFLNKAETETELQNGRRVVEVLQATAPDRFKRVLIGSLFKDPPIREFYDFSRLKG